MALLINIIAIFMLLLGVFHFHKAVTNRYQHAYYRLGKLKIPFWITKAGASIFISGLGIYILFLH